MLIEKTTPYLHQHGLDHESLPAISWWLLFCFLSFSPAFGRDQIAVPERVYLLISLGYGRHGDAKQVCQPLPYQPLSLPASLVDGHQRRR